MINFHFIRPFFLYLLIPFGVLLLLFFRSRMRANNWHDICDKDLMPHILVAKNKSSMLSWIIMPSFLALLIIGLAGPAWQESLEPIFKRETSLVILLDLSDSMNADDIKPTRLKRAIYKINDLLELRKDGQTALVVFSGQPFIVAPLTHDIATIQSQLSVLDTSIMPARGHNVNKAVEKALNLLNQTGAVDGSILVVTSELKQQDLEKTMELLKGSRVKLSVLGIGGESTTPILKPNGGFMKDKNGSFMMTTLAKDQLKELSHATNGTYLNISVDDSDIQQLAKEFEGGFLNSKMEETYASLKKWQDEGYWAVLLALPFVSLIFRRGFLSVIFLIMPLGLQASIWNDYFQTADGRGESLYNLQEYERAKEEFENLDWKACAHYQLKEYEKAAELFQPNTTSKGLYNYGTARAKAGDFKEALDAYEKVLEIEPDHEDALYNKKLIEEFQKNQEQNQDQKSQDKNKESEKDKNSEKKDGDKDENGEQKSDSSEENQDSERKSDDKPEEKNQDSGKDGEDKNEEEPEVKKEEPQDLKDQYKDQVEKEMSKNESEEDDKADKDADTEQNLNDQNPEDLQRQIDDRWLQRVKDDPGGLLRRKFLLQYKQQLNGSKR